MANAFVQTMSDASVDADTLGEFANEDKTVTSRMGLEYPSAPMASRLVVENGLLGATPFNTYAAMSASVLVNGDYAVVTNDVTTANNGFYQKKSGVWEFLQWNPLSQLVSFYSDVMQYEPQTDVDIIESENLYQSALKANSVYVKRAGAVITALAGSQVCAIPVQTGQSCVILSSFTQSFVLPSVSNNNDLSAGKEVQLITEFTSTTVSAGLYKIEFVVPNGFSHLIFNTKVGATVANPFFIGLYGSIISKIGGADIVDKQARAQSIPSRLSNKRWVVIGDSITEKNSRTNLNYHDFIKNDVQDLTVYNYGKSGTGYFDRSNVASLVTQTDINIITVFLGTNDWGNQKSTNQKQLGSFLDTGTTTISGCINTTLSALIDKFYDKKIAVITPLPRLTNWGENAENNAYGYTLKQLSELIIKYCNHYSLPCLDLYHESNLPVWTPAANTLYFTAPSSSAPDGLHPNDAGHRIIADKIKAFLESI